MKDKPIEVIKRDGRIVDFDKSKIVIAITKAFKSADDVLLENDPNVVLNKEYEAEKANAIADYIYEKAESLMEKEGKSLSIEEIQDMVEAGLQNTKRKDVARAYIIYRNDRTRERNRKSELTKEVGKKLMASDVQNQNANIDEKSFGGRKGEAADEMSKDYALNYLMSPMARDNHLNNEIYTHDLNSYAIGCHNCLSCPVDDLLANGFTTRQTDIRPANSVSTAFQLLAVIFQIQSLQMFGKYPCRV